MTSERPPPEGADRSDTLNLNLNLSFWRQFLNGFLRRETGFRLQPRHSVRGSTLLSAVYVPVT